ncbi:MAG: ABC transporter permease [FCB group bacterium]|nr:ABC transporter permease [FCB group bacterium]
MSRIFIVFKKEFKDMIRDRRTIFFMVVFPIIFLPIFIGGFPKLLSSITEKKMDEILTIAIVGGENAPELLERFRNTESMIILTDVPEADIREAIDEDNIAGAVVIHPGFSVNLKQMKPASIEAFFRSSDDMEAAKKRMASVLEAYADSILEDRYRQLNLNSDNFKPLDIAYNNIASTKEMLGKTAGGFLPYIFIIYCFLGAMYPALDLGAGEKERGTLETILASPATRLEILLGKFGVVTLFGMISAFMGMVGMLIGLRGNTDIPAEIQTVIMSIISFKMVVTIITLLIPVAIFFAAFLLSISIYARTFKEAQSIVGPLNVIIILPALIGLIPGIELNYLTAMIPIVNISLATKEVIAGTITPGLLTEVYLSLTALAALGILLASRWFNKEQVIFRN